MSEAKKKSRCPKGHHDQHRHKARDVERHMRPTVQVLVRHHQEGPGDRIETVWDQEKCAKHGQSPLLLMNYYDIDIISYIIILYQIISYYIILYIINLCQQSMINL